MCNVFNGCTGHYRLHIITASSSVAIMVTVLLLEYRPLVDVFLHIHASVKGNVQYMRDLNSLYLNIVRSCTCRSSLSMSP